MCAKQIPFTFLTYNEFTYHIIKIQTGNTQYINE